MYCQFCGTDLGKKKDCVKCAGKKKALSFQPKLAKDFSTEEKVKVFDSLHQSALTHFEGRRDGSIHEDNDDQHYMYEDQMSLMLGKGVFDAMKNF